MTSSTRKAPSKSLRDTADVRRIVYKISRKVTLILTYRPRVRLSRLLVLLLNSSALCAVAGGTLPGSAPGVAGSITLPQTARTPGNSVPPANQTTFIGLPTGAQVVSGNITVQQPSRNTLDVVQTSGQGVINWNSF